MKPVAALYLALFGAMTLTAQTPTNQSGPRGTASTEGVTTVTTYNSATQKTTTVVVPLSQLTACPVSVHAQQSSKATAMEVDSSRPKGLAQLLHLTLAKADSSRITNATVNVRGLLPKTRATLTPMTLGADPSDAIRTLDIAFPAGPEAGKNAIADLWVPGLSAVYSIDLVSITYADGSTWKIAAGKTCRTPIDGVMLVGGR